MLTAAFEESRCCWLYRSDKGHVMGPFTDEEMLQKIREHVLQEGTFVAREGGLFVPLKTIPFFWEAFCVCRVQEQQRKKTFRQRVALGTVCVSLLGLLGWGWFLGRVHTARMEEVALKKKAAQEQAWVRRQAALKSGYGLDLVALVSKDPLEGSAAEGAAGVAKRLARVVSGAASLSDVPHVVSEQATPSSEGMEVSACELDQEKIFSVLRKHVGAFNACVLDEKKRRPDATLPSIVDVSFVIRPSGRVVDFELEEAVLREGSLRNCFMRVVDSMVFPEHSGTACPVSLPVRIAQS